MQEGAKTSVVLPKPAEAEMSVTAAFVTAWLLG